MLDDAQDVDGTIVAFELAIAIVGAEPLVDDIHDLDAAAIEMKRERQLPACITSGFDLNAHKAPSVLVVWPVASPEDKLRHSLLCSTPFSDFRVIRERTRNRCDPRVADIEAPSDGLERTAAADCGSWFSLARCRRRPARTGQCRRDAGRMVDRTR